MTKSLTKQWRDGTLPAWHYYCKLYYNGFKPRIQECVKSAYSPKSCIPMSCGCEGEEVLGPVPRYEDVKQFADASKKVKELEKRLEVSEKEHYRTLEQLRIAIAALKEYERCENGSYASKALALIKEVK